MDWRDQYRDKLLTPAQAAQKVESGQRVLLSLGTMEPQHTANALCERWQELNQVEILTSNTMHAYPWFDPERAAAFQIQAGYLSAYLLGFYQCE